MSWTYSSERGVTASSNDNILAVAGASHSQLYHYFTDRDDLVAAVMPTASSRPSATKNHSSLTSTASKAYDSGVTPPLRAGRPRGQTLMPNRITRR